MNNYICQAFSLTKILTQELTRVFTRFYIMKIIFYKRIISGFRSVF